MPLKSLDEELLQAHQKGDGHALVKLYRQAGESAADDGRSEAAAFYLTHAYVYALELGDPRAPDIHAVLRSWGKEQ